MGENLDSSAPASVYGAPFEHQIAIRLSSIRLLPLSFLAVSPREQWTASSDLWPTEPLPAGVDAVAYHSLRQDEEMPVRTLHGDWLRYVWLSYLNYYIDFTIGYEEYLKKFSSKTRNTLRRKAKKVQKENNGVLDIRGFHTVEQLKDFKAHALPLSGRTYQDKLFDGGLPTDDSFWDSARDLAREDALRAYLLFMGDRPVSYLFLPGRDRELAYSHLGYDPEFRNLSVGTVLLWTALQQLFEEGRFERLDFTEGEGPQKQRYATHSERCCSVIFFRRNARFRTYTFLHRTVESSVTSLASVLQRIGLRQSFRKWLRSSA